jgi:queuosine precursor transporter
VPTSALIVTYLAAIVTANLVTAAGGPTWSVVMSFALIPFNLTVRDNLHERWEGGPLVRNMALLIASGSVLSAALSINALPIAVASFVAFAVAATLDTAVYARLAGRSKLARMIGSNSVSSAADSFVFTALAFGAPILWGIILADYVVKLLGGVLWAFILSHLRDVPEAEAAPSATAINCLHE